MRTLLAVLIAIAWPVTAYAAGDCSVLKDGQYVYDWSAEQPTIVGYSCKTTSGPRFPGSDYTDFEIRCEGLPPIGISFAQGNLYSYDMSARIERLLICN